MGTLTIVLENHDGKDRTWGHIVREDGTVDMESYVTQIEAGELDNAFGDAEECPRCEAHLDSDDCDECGMTAEEIAEANRPQCANFDTCGQHIFMGDWDNQSYGEYYCGACVTILDEIPSHVTSPMFP